MAINAEDKQVHLISFWRFSWKVQYIKRLKSAAWKFLKVINYRHELILTKRRHVMKGLLWPQFEGFPIFKHDIDMFNFKIYWLTVSKIWKIAKNIFLVWNLRHLWLNIKTLKAILIFLTSRFYLYSNTTLNFKSNMM